MITVNDKASVLDTNQRRDLEATNASSHVVVNLVNAGSPGELDVLTQNCVSSPNTLCIGRDNSHKWTSVHAGLDLGIKGDGAVEVRKAGNADFRSGDVVGGLKAIVSRSEAVRMKQNQTAVIVENQVVRHETSYWPLFVIGGGLIVIMVFFVVKARRSARKAEEAMRVSQSEAADAVSSNISSDRDRDLNRRFAQMLERPEGADHMAVGGIVPVEAAVRPDPVRYTPPSPPRAPMPVRAPEPVLRPSRVVVHHHHHRTPAPVVVSTPVVVNSGPDFMDGVLIGEALGRREPAYEPPRRRERTPTPEPVRTSAPSWGGSTWGGSTRDSEPDTSPSLSVTSDDDNSSVSDTSNVGSDDD